MFQRILVPLDGSARAQRALPVAARLARASGGSIILVQALSIDIDLYLVPQPTLIDRVINVELAEAERYLLTLASSPPLAGVPTETVALFGSAASSLLSVVHSSKADLIVLCSHGRTGMTRWALGSVAEKVARQSPVPVFVLREGGPVLAGPSPDATRPLRVLVPLDGSASAKAALEPAAYLIAALAAPAPGLLHMMRVVQPPATASWEKGQILSKAKMYLRSIEDQLREGLEAPAVAKLKLPVTWSVALDMDVASAIIRVAENGEDAEGAGIFGGCDVIAMATHGRGGLQHWAMGSITERVLHGTRLPLLIVRPPNGMDKSHLTQQEPTVAAIQD